MRASTELAKGGAAMFDDVIDLAAVTVIDFEGLKLAPYLCPAGKLTVGVGHVIRRGESALKSGVSRQQAVELLHADLQVALDDVRRGLPAECSARLTVGQWAALVSFVFNVGGPAWRSSTLRCRVVAGDDAAAAAEFGRWVKAGGKVLPGLVKRRARESAIYLGEWKQ